MAGVTQQQLDDLDARLAKYQAKAAPAAPAEPEPTLDDVNALLEKYEGAAVPRATSVPPKDSAALQKKIDAGMLPVPSKLQMAGEAIRESNQEVGQQLADQTLFGVPGKVLRAAGAYGAPVQPIPEPGQGDAHRPEDYAPTERTLTSVPAAAIDMATVGGPVGEAGEAIGAAPKALARKLGASEAQQAARPAVQAAADAAGGGAVFGGTDAALRGGSPAEVAEGAGVGALGGAAMSVLPAAAGAAERGLSKAVARNDVASVKQMAKKGSLDKALAQFGNGDPEVGKQQMLDFVQREDLGPVLRVKGERAVSDLEKRRKAVYDTDLAPIYRWAKAAEPDASVSVDEIAKRLRASVRAEGGNEAELVEKAIAKLYERNASLRSRGSVPADAMPLDVLLTNARDFQSAGHAGVVNYLDPPESKMVARQIGGTLRSIANERVARIYERNPEAAVALYTGTKPRTPGITFRDQPSTPDMVRADQYKNDWARRWEAGRELAKSVPAKLAEGNRRYSDYAKLEPLVEQAATLKAGEKHFGLISLLKHGGITTTAGAAGYLLGGVEGAAITAGGINAVKAAYPYAARIGASTAGMASGPAVPNGLPGALTALPLEPSEDRR